jgi:hypothetical protein
MAGRGPPGRAWLLVTTAELSSRFIFLVLVRGGVLALCRAPKRKFAVMHMSFLSLIHIFWDTDPVLKGLNFWGKFRILRCRSRFYLYF